MFVFIIFVSSLLLASGTSDAKCVQGHSYNDGCNKCTCTNGEGYACTLRFCDNNPVVCYIPGNASTCTAGHTYNDGCNDCTCINGVGYACTKKFCADNPVVCYVQ